MPIKHIKECPQCGSENVENKHCGSTPIAVCEDCQWYTETYEPSGEGVYRCRRCGETRIGRGPEGRCMCGGCLKPDSGYERFIAGLDKPRSGVKAQ